MNFDKIKKEVEISSYLESIGCKPNSYNGNYSAPYREDNTPSLSVDKTLNLWYDFGLGKGGNVIQLVALINNCTDYDAAKILVTNKNSFSFYRNDFKQLKSIGINKIKKLENTALLEYLASRNVNINIAQAYCKEAYYTVNSKRYFAIAFENDSKGYELRNKYFKGCTSKDITHLKNEANELFLFEGFIDFLSYLTLKKESKMLSFDTIVLNSIANIRHAKEEFENYETVNLFLDNDESGQDLTAELLNEFPSTKDFSHHYKGYKDLNEYLTKRKLF